jgi:phosphonate transport system substrate-binding protein
MKPQDAFSTRFWLIGDNRSHIITKKDSGIKSIEDAKGKVWAFTDPNSTSGTLVPTV